MARNISLQVIRGIASAMPALASGELYFAMDTNQLYVGSISSGNLPVGGGGGGINRVQATVDFGSDSGAIKRSFDVAVTVSATWVTAESIIVCSMAGIATATHGVDDALIEGLIPVVDNLNPGIGFTIRVYSPLGSWGQYVVNAIGM